jgi:hypothetical protein
MNYTFFGSAAAPGTYLMINGNYASAYTPGYVHELGHNLGMQHANTPPNNEYGDLSCVMGGTASSGLRHFNSPHKFQMGWIEPTSIGASGSYDLNALERQPDSRSTPQTVLKLRDSIAGQDLYISYRSPEGDFSGDLSVPFTTSVHSYAGGFQKTFLLATLNDGQSFTQNGINIKQVSHTNNRASVELSMPCITSAPSISFTPLSQSLTSVSPLQYTVRVQNNDAACNGPSAFTLSVTTPNNLWTSTLTPPSITLSAGASASTILQLDPPINLSPGSYDILVQAQATAHLPGTGATSITLLSGSPPSAPLNLSVVNSD